MYYLKSLYIDLYHQKRWSLWSEIFCIDEVKKQGLVIVQFFRYLIINLNYQQLTYELFTLQRVKC